MNMFSLVLSEEEGHRSQFEDSVGPSSSDSLRKFAGIWPLRRGGLSPAVFDALSVQAVVRDLIRADR